MAARRYLYSVGNEEDPGDPWGASAPSGYAETFDVLDGVIRHVTGGAVAYPSTRGDIVSEIAEAPARRPLI